MPPPDPRSRTTSPGSIFARAVGFPHPSEARRAFSGTSARSEIAYRFDVIGSPDSPEADVFPQHDALPDSACRAASPYFSRTTSVMFWSVMVPSKKTSRNLDVLNTRRSFRTARGGLRGALAVSQGRDRAPGGLQAIRVQGVVDPAAFPPIDDESGLLQDLHVEREPGLSGPEQVHEVADTTLPVAEPAEHREPRLIGEGVEDPGHLRLQFHGS